jgi:hypothetical protein
MRPGVAFSDWRRDRAFPYFWRKWRSLAALLRIVHERAGRLAIELWVVSYADSSGLTVLVRYQAAGAAGGRMPRLAAPGHGVASTPTTTGSIGSYMSMPPRRQ